ncbi:hypothetical protein [Flagellimonas lutimaris]
MAQADGEFHLIVEGMNTGLSALTRYQRVIFKIQ